MANEMTAAEAAEKLELLIDYAGDTLDDALEFNLRRAVGAAASYLRKIASGEYAPVIHAHWISDSSNPDNDPLIATAIFENWQFRCSHCGDKIIGSKSKHCGKCGALMDGKDDSHA